MQQQGGGSVRIGVDRRGQVQLLETRGRGIARVARLIAAASHRQIRFQNGFQRQLDAGEADAAVVVGGVGCESGGEEGGGTGADGRQDSGQNGCILNVISET